MSCGAPPPAPTPPNIPREEPLLDGSLTDYLPAAGVNWLLLAEPVRLSGNHQLVRTLEPLLPASRLDLYARDTKLDLRTLSHAAVAGFDLGVLYLAETDTDLTPATLAFADRLVIEPEIKRPHPKLTRVSGVVGTTPQSLLQFEGKLLAVAVGDPTTVRIVEAFARKKLKRSPSIFQGVALKSFAEFAAGAPLVFLAAGPFEGRWMFGGAGLLAAASAVGIRATPTSDGRALRVSVAIEGPWEEEGAEPVLRMEQAWQALAESSTGRLFGFHELAQTPVVRTTKNRVTLDVELELAPIVHGLRAAVAADVWEMLDVGPTSAPSPSRNGPSSPESLPAK
ncbi:MAG TPA: hypothetical protein VFU02_14405 [Polyangiaceae bacterium]|nr:hypothetical protein [Polyangiaceae bacterium]